MIGNIVTFFGVAYSNIRILISYVDCFIFDDAEELIFKKYRIKLYDSRYKIYKLL